MRKRRRGYMSKVQENRDGVRGVLAKVARRAAGTGS